MNAGFYECLSIKELLITELLDTPLMATTGKFSFQPGFDYSLCHTITNHPGPQTKNIGIVMLSAQTSRILVMAEGCTDAGKSVCNQRHADTRSTDKDTNIT